VSDKREHGLGWERLLAALDAEREAAAKAYQGLHQRLAQRFAWRGADDPAALADLTFDRVADKLAAGEEVRDIVGFTLGVARFVELEAARRASSERTAIEKERGVPAADPDESAEHERRVAALQRCLEALEATERELMLDYHQGRGQARIERRQRLADALSVGLNALRIRVHRLRARLQGCVEGRLKNRGNVLARVATSDLRGHHG
jgi:DNA-directed RNA polymerase specialized sigma24 family protein